MTRPVGAFLLTAAVMSCAAPARPAPSPVAQRDRQLDSARSIMSALSDTRDARRAGYRRIAPEGLTDLNPFAGEHWINARYNRSPTLDLARPAYLMFYPLLGEDSLTLVGAGYTVAQPAGATSPAGFAAGDDRWHVHLPCSRVPGLHAILAESRAGCEEVDGQPGDWQIAMVHVWAEDFPSPDGVFAQFNPALPFLVVGIAPPTSHELADTGRARLLRALGLALGETYGAVPRMGARIAQNRDSLFADRVRPYRQRIRALLPSLRDARGEWPRFQTIAAEAVAAWRAIRDAYLDAAWSPQHRLILDRWFEAALAGHHGTQLRLTDSAEHP